MKKIKLLGLLIIQISIFVKVNAQDYLNLSKDSVEIDKLIAIHKKYGVSDKIKISSAIKGRELQKKIVLRMSLAAYEDYVKKISFENKQSEIMKLFLKDYDNVKSVKEYTALLRTYRNKYPEYLKDKPFFQEQSIKMIEKNTDNVSIFNKHFDANGKKLK